MKKNEKKLILQIKKKYFPYYSFFVTPLALHFKDGL